MSYVVVIMKILPSSSETDMKKILEKIKRTLSQEYSIIDHKEEDIAFGLKSLILGIRMPENKEGGTFELEEIISNIDGVGSISILGVSRA